MRPQNKNLRPFKKGQSGNPSGKPKQLLTKDKVYSIIGRFAAMNRDELHALVQNPKTPIIEIVIASIMVKAAKDGDYARMNFILDRSIGKISNEEHSQNNANSMIAVTPENIAELCRLAREGSKPKDESNK